MRNALILVLDELTTGLDEENAQLVTDAIERLSRGRTTFIVTHDLDVATRADTVVYIEDGQVVEQGTHDQLMMRDGRYAALYRLQNAQRAFMDEPEEIDVVVS